MEEGIKPDVEVKPDTMSNISMYLDRMDSTEVMFDYVVDYIGKHPTIAPANDFHLTDADYAALRSVSSRQASPMTRSARNSLRNW